MNDMTQAQKVAAGQNVIRKVERGDGETLQIHEVFMTIQGEGPFSGRRAVFVRETGCSLGCWWCDTVWDDGGDKWSVVEKIVDRVVVAWAQGTQDWSFNPSSSPDPLIVLTGGEPLRQPQESLLAEIFRRMPNAKVQIETAGVHYQDCINRAYVYTVVSPKTAKVDECIRHLACAWKYIIRAEDPRDPEDGLPTASTQRKGEIARLARPPATTAREDIFVSPCDEGDPIKNAANLELCVGLVKVFGYRLSLQVHKIANLP